MKRKNKAISYRTCIYSNKEFNKEELVRLVKVNNVVIIDHKQDLPGRGWWIKLCDEMFSDQKTIQILSKHLRCRIGQDLVEELKNLWKKQK